MVVYYTTNSGVGFTLVCRSTSVVADGSVLRFECIGSNYYIYDDGVLIFSGTDGGAVTTGTPGILASDDTDIIDNWSGGSIILDALSSTDAGFTAGHPFTSGAAKDYTVQSALSSSTTYYWRVRAIDPSGTNTWGGWATTRSFTTESGGAGPVNHFLSLMGVGP